MKTYADPVKVEQELRKIQQEASSNEVRTNLFNLVVYVDQNEDSKVTDALNFLHGKRAARVIVVRRNAGGETRTDVTARCVTDNNDKVLCVQEIVINSGADGAGETPETWTPLLIREIPVFVWWLADLEKAPLPEMFETIADRVFVDSSLAKDPVAFLAKLSSKQADWKIPVTDLAWSRSAPLLKLTANAFNAATRRPLLTEITSITFTGGMASEVVLYFQWLKSKLDWKGVPASAGKSWSMKDESGASVTLKHAKPATLDEGFSIEFQTRSGKVLNLKDSRKGYAEAEVAGLDTYTSMFRYQDEGEALLNEVDKNASDRLFLDLLAHWN